MTLNKQPNFGKNTKKYVLYFIYLVWNANISVAKYKIQPNTHVD